jgi:uncharacterized protein (TIGR03000 family)
MKIQWLSMSFLAVAAFLLSPAAGQAQVQIREGVYRYPPSTYSTVPDYPTLPPGRRGLGIGENPQPPYPPPTYYNYPTFFDRPTYFTSINYPFLYGGHFYLTDGARGGLLESFPADYKYTHSSYNPNAPLPSSSSLYSVSGVDGLASMKSMPTERATITVRVPNDAKVWFQGNLMEPRGTLRRFYSPPLRQGQEYEYEVQGQWTRGTEVVNVGRKIRILAGQHLDIDLEAPQPSMNTAIMRARELPVPVRP